MKRIAVLVIGLMCAAANASLGAETPKQNPAMASLTGVPSAELPARAADLVKRAKSREQKNVTENVVRAAAQINPAALPQVVGAISKAAPDMASLAAGLAAAEQPKYASAIAAAAAGAAPSNAGKVVTAVCRAVPNEYRHIAIAVAQVVPGSAQDVLKSVGAAFPTLKPSIDSALAGYKGNTPSVEYVLSTAKPVTTASTDAAITAGTTPSAPTRTVVRGPSSGDPYVPLSGTPATITPTTSGTQPSHGRDYAKP